MKKLILVIILLSNIALANDNSKHTIFLNYEKNLFKAYNILSKKNEPVRTDCFSMEHCNKWELFDCMFKLYALFQIIKISKNYDEGIANPKAQELITNYTKSYDVFKDDWSIKLGDVIARQKLEIENDFKNLES